MPAEARMMQEQHMEDRDGLTGEEKQVSAGICCQAKENALPVALRSCISSEEPMLSKCVGSLLDASGLSLSPGMRVLVKPNLLRADPLSCTDPHVVAAVCRWLLDQGCRVTVSDSPGFGRAESIAREIGLEQALFPLNLRCTSLTQPIWEEVLVHERSLQLPVAQSALDCDLIMSVPRIKAHSQLALTLCVKNCFGCVPGMHKACMHTLYGKHEEIFAGLLAALLDLLPPVAGFCDGIVAMHVTGPSKGQPYPLHLLGASVSALALDRAICTVLGQRFEALPLGRELLQRFPSCLQTELFFPFSSPDDCRVTDFIVPRQLLTMSFAPHRLLVSCLRRLWAKWMHR